MLSKLIKNGTKIELQSVGGQREQWEESENRVYQSKVYDILSEDRMEILMPMEKTKLILLPVDGEYNCVFYVGTGLYQSFVRIIDRYKSNNIYMLVVELTSNLRKYQRRQYYRFSCALEMFARNLEEEELSAVEKNQFYSLQPGLPLKTSVIVDISGGGLRFISTQRYEPNSLIYCTYQLLKDGERKEYEVIGKILAVQELENKPGTFEHRVQYYNMENSTREEIIRFIFEEERKNRKRESGM